MSGRTQHSSIACGKNRDPLADIVVEEKVIVEVKVLENFEKVHEAQLLNYMKATGMKVGLLVNFRYPKAAIKRMAMNLGDPSRVNESLFGKGSDTE